jgi:4-hydroxy-tetrahydrodipicolinate reductase
MGQELQAALQTPEFEPQFKFVGGSSKHHFIGEQENRDLPQALAEADVILDFSSAEGSPVLQQALQKAGIRNRLIIVGSTGLSESVIQKWHVIAATQEHRVLIAANTSRGILESMRTLRILAALARDGKFDIEIIETHHSAKVDAPSGTALLLAQTLLRELPGWTTIYGHARKRAEKSIGLHAVRGGGVVGEHTIRFIGQHEEVSILHRAFKRSLFAEGALQLVTELMQKQPGHCYSLFDL